MLLASVGWKRGCQPFSCPWSENVTYYRKEICSTCLFTAIPVGNAKHPLPTRSLRLLRAAVRSTSSVLCLHYACKRSHPFVQDSGFVFHAKKQSVWSWSCRLQDLLRTIQWLCPRFGLQDIDCALRWHVTAANQWIIVEIELLATVGWKRGCHPFSCRCSQNVTNCRKEICSSCLSKGIHAFCEI